MLRLTALRRAAYQPSHVLSRTGPAFRQMATSTKPRKPGVATDDELASFVSTHQTNVVVVDARNSNFTVEPGDEKTAAIAPLGGPTRPRTVNLPYDRANKSMDLAPLEPLLVDGKDTPIITHCGGGGRGQKAKDFLLANGFTNVINGGGPEEPDLWKLYGSM